MSIAINPTCGFRKAAAKEEALPSLLVLNTTAPQERIESQLGTPLRSPKHLVEYDDLPQDPESQILEEVIGTLRG